jgi:site-specific recombinase XerD
MRDGTPTLGHIAESFFRDTLATQRRASPRTVASYRDSLKLFLVFVSKRKGRPPSSLTVADLNADELVAFLNHLESERGCSIATRNVRRTALRTFFRHVGYQDPGALGVVERALLVPSKRCDQAPVDFLRPDEQEPLVAAPDRGTVLGRRDHAMLQFLIHTGARESEVVAVDMKHARRAVPRQVVLFGKGSKQRIVPLDDVTVDALERMLADRRDALPEDPLFVSRSGERMVRHGVIHVVRRHAAQAAKKMSSLGERSVTPHLLRHTCAMNLLRRGVDITTVRSWLGHVNVQTTHMYTDADAEMKRKALESCPVTVPEATRFEAPDAVLAMLEAL